MRLFVSALILCATVCLSTPRAHAQTQDLTELSRAIEVLSMSQQALYDLVASRAMTAIGSCSGNECGHPSNSACKCVGSSSCSVAGSGSAAQVICKSGTSTTTCTYTNDNCVCTTT